MHADDFDVETEPGFDLPDAYDEWPIGDPDDKQFNRRDDGRAGHVVIGVRLSPQDRILVEQLPARDENTGGLEGRFGTWTPTNIDTGPMADYEADVRDALSNRPLGSRAPYEVYGREISANDMAGGTWPADNDLSAAQVREWARARGDDHLTDIMDRLNSEGL